MADTTTLYVLVGLSVLQLVFMLGAVINAYRISRLLGSFLGWTLVIIGLALFTIRNASSLLILPFYTPSQLDQLLGSVGTGTLIASSALNVAAPLILVLGMYFLKKTFESKLKKDEDKT
jgi:hypothetical protein